MTRSALLVALSGILFAAGCTSGAEPPPGPDPVASTTSEAPSTWGEAFARRGAVGTMVLYDAAADHTQRHDAERAATRFTPASTSKVFNGLVFLDRGVLEDPDSLLAWDGTPRRLDVWNRDHSLRTATEVSAVWFFQRLANEVGPRGYDAVFARYPYGNSEMGTPLDLAWLNGTLQVSADEQVAFLDGLRRGALPFDAADQATVRDVLPVLAEGDGWALKAKTGWGLREGAPDIGWLVGWVGRPAGDLVFAMNAEAEPGKTFDVGPSRLAIVREILAAEDVVPAR